MAIINNKPLPFDGPRRVEASRRRQEATDVSINRAQPGISLSGPPTESNGEEHPNFKYAMNFSKGIPRDEYGLPVAPAYEAFVDAINADSAYLSGGEDRFDAKVSLGPPLAKGHNAPMGALGDHDDFYSKDDNGKSFEVRNWESPRAGHAYDLQGPDADAVCMPPAPTAASHEMAVEMAEVYAMALLRDVPFSDIEAGSADGHNYGADKAATDIADMSWFGRPVASGTGQQRRREARRLKPTPSGSETAAKKRTRLKENAKQLFRGSTVGCEVGPYLSQFMLVGNEGRAGVKASNTGTTCPGVNARFEHDDGYILYGQQIVDQRVFSPEPAIDYMTDWHVWMDVQNAAKMNGYDLYRSERRFITTPRDLAGYVHFDQLYQAYLNACLMMLSAGEKDRNGESVFPIDKGFPSGLFMENSTVDVHRTRGSFATFGGPHVLSLLTEVATRALRAVRRQKFNYHRRCRPETIGAMLTVAKHEGKTALGDAHPSFDAMLAKLPDRLLAAVAARNADLATPEARDARRIKCTEKTPAWLEGKDNYLLPMAFPEGSPMHPSYGAGHATVAGACVTVIKAFFEMYGDRDARTLAKYPLPIYEADPDNHGCTLRQLTGKAGGRFSENELEGVTIAGELDKLAANISIGRNMAGVHFYTDYYDSLRMGERVAVAILQEQMTNYADNVEIMLPGFGGEHIRIRTEQQGRNPGHFPPVEIYDEAVGFFQDAPADWWLCNP